KWHLGLGNAEKVDYAGTLRPGPVDHGFDRYFGIPASLDMEPYVYIENERTAEQPTAKTPGQDKPRGVFWRPGPIAPGLKIEEVLPTLRDRAVSYLRERARSPSEPFFLYLPLTGPHTPWVPKPEFQGKSGAGIYGDFVAQVDDTLGAVMRTLDEAGLADNTILIYTSDNGAHWSPEDQEKYPHRANGTWRGMKADIHEAGHRVPFIVRWPGKARAGSVSDATACLTDLMATSAEIAGVRLPSEAGEDSFSFVPALTGGKTNRAAVVHHSMEGVFAIRAGDWKLVEGRGSGGFSAPVRVDVKSGEPAGELYNLRHDPGETQNLYLMRPEIVAKLSALLERYRKDGRSRPA
ncbi:MAG TPA: sulfatase-like hydrolase/transferase, partial [Bryobacteraceae bacterium]|nr:sulfatase-like hydrolase/transferase [Bryobacteraceae bacterium]